MQGINRLILIVSISFILVFGVEYPIFAGFGVIIYHQANADRNSQPGINGHSDPTSQANGGNGGGINFFLTVAAQATAMVAMEVQHINTAKLMVVLAEI